MLKHAFLSEKSRFTSFFSLDDDWGLRDSIHAEEEVVADCGVEMWLLALEGGDELADVKGTCGEGGNTRTGEGLGDDGLDLAGCETLAGTSERAQI